MAQLTKDEAANLLAFVERGVHPRFAGLQKVEEVPLYHHLRGKLLAIINEADAPPAPSAEVPR